ncbi:MAG: resA [Deltaproteobacteria bacterium]|nr:resA [Deltaproteobacteria bacterium]
MGKYFNIIIAFLMIVFLVSPATSWSQYIPNAPFKPELTQAPDFTLKDLQGKTFRLSAQRGKPVLIFFGTTWCPGCRAEIPKYKEVHKTYSPRGLEVIYINIMEPAKKVIRFAQSNSLPYRTLLDEDGSVGNAYSVIGVPMIMLLDKAGNIVKVGHSSKDMPLDNVLK